MEAVLSPVPGLRTVVREQFRSVGLSLRREALVAGGFIGLASVWVAWMSANSRGEGLPLTPDAAIPAAMLGLLVPMAVWKGEGPARRGYHHAMPVNQAAHAAVRALSGLAWLMVAIAGYFGWLAMMTAITGGRVDHVEPFRWIVPFAGGAVMYLLGSALTLVTTHPWRWMGGTVVGYMFLQAFRAADGSRPLAEMADTVIAGRYGLVTLMSGMSPAPRFEYVVRHADASVWLLSTWMWLAIAITAFLYAAYRQPER
jgi:hypothetical protein